MKRQTRIELTILIAVAVLLGGWIGLRLTSSGTSTEETPVAAANTPQADALSPPRTDPPKEQSPIRPATIRAESPEKTSPPTAEPPYRPVEPKTPPANSPLTRGIAKAQSLIADENLLEARALLTELILTAPEGALRNHIKARLDNLNKTMFFSRGRSKDCIFYKMQPGDSLARIAKKEGRDYYFARLIQHINGIRNPNRVRVGKMIKIPRGAFSAVVQKRAHRLLVFLNGQYIKEYRVGIGAPATPTPAGTFVIATKEVHPDWYAPDGNVYKYGHPRNILGSRWIGFEDKGDYQSYGIHGTADPSSIGKNISNGCVRMLSSDVEEIFNMLMAGDAVRIAP